jgi:NAD(P)-dependent dehydrogenase (short-subunit alcohol dehydrogenase family)
MKHAEASSHDFIKNHPDRLDILIANAGVSMQTPDKLSSDGYEPTFQTNQLGHFAFIQPLLPLFEKTAKEHGEARVVMTSSDAHAFAKNGIEFETLSKTSPHIGIRGMPDAMRRYGATKLALMLYARRLDREWAAPLREKGTMVFADCAHPGEIYVSFCMMD